MKPEATSMKEWSEPALLLRPRSPLTKLLKRSGTPHWRDTVKFTFKNVNVSEDVKRLQRWETRMEVHLPSTCNNSYNGTVKSKHTTVSEWPCQRPDLNVDWNTQKDLKVDVTFIWSYRTEFELCCKKEQKCNSRAVQHWGSQTTRRLFSKSFCSETKYKSKTLFSDFSPF